MSINSKKRIAKEVSNVDFDRINVNQHSKLRFMQRVDADDPHPADRIREMFRLGYPFPSADVESGHCRRYRDYLIVYRGSEGCPEVITILLAGDHQ